jgi:hypothetical protein
MITEKEVAEREYWSSYNDTTFQGGLESRDKQSKKFQLIWIPTRGAHGSNPSQANLCTLLREVTLHIVCTESSYLTVLCEEDPRHGKIKRKFFKVFVPPFMTRESHVVYKRIIFIERIGYISNVFISDCVQVNDPFFVNDMFKDVTGWGNIMIRGRCCAHSIQYCLAQSSQYSSLNVLLIPCYIDEHHDTEHNLKQTKFLFINRFEMWR